MHRVWILVVLTYSLCLYEEVSALGETFEIDKLAAGSTIAKVIGERFQKAIHSVLPKANQSDSFIIRDGMRLRHVEESRFGYMPLDGQQQQYLPAGYAYISYSNIPTDKTCQKSSIEVGVPANTCLSGGNYGFKIQLTEDSCDEAMIEYFSDHNCTTAVQQSRMDLGEFSGCNPFTGDSTIDLGDGNTVAVPLYFWKVHCTAQPTKPVNAPSVTLDLYNGDAPCTGFAGYVNFATDMCFPVNDGAMSLGLRCATEGSASLTQFWGSKCGMTYAPSPFPPTCALVSDGLPDPPASSGSGANTGGGGAPQKGTNDNAGQGEMDNSQRGTGAPVSRRGQGGGEGEDVSEDDDGEGAGSHDDDGEGGGEDDGESKGSDDVDVDLDLDFVDQAGLRSYQLTCASRNTNYGAIVSVSQLLATTADALRSYKAHRAAHTIAFQRAVADSVGSGLSSSNVYLSTVRAAPVTAKPTPTPTAPPTTYWSTSRPTQGPTATLSKSTLKPSSAPTAAATKTSVPLVNHLEVGPALNGTTAVGGEGIENCLNVVYTVVSYSARLDNARLAGSLKRAVSDGVFDDLLNLYAQTEGANGLIGAKSKEVQVRTPDEDPESPRSDSDQTALQRYLGQVGSKGVAVGGGVSLGLGLLVVLLRWWLRRRKVGVMEDKSKAVAIATVLKEDGDLDGAHSKEGVTRDIDIEVALCEEVSLDEGASVR